MPETPAKPETDPRHESQPEPQPKTATPAPAWAPGDLEGVHERSDKHERVRRMFSSIASRYDLNNRLHSFWLDQAWRRFAVRAAKVAPGERVLDVACGTGDLTFAFARRSPASEVVGGDYTDRMLDFARLKERKLDEALRDRVSFVHADAMDLQYEDGSFDVISIAFGIRNVQDPERAVREFARVLRPGGRLVVLEFDTPRNPVVRTMDRFYRHQVMPRTASLIAGDRSGAYRYLPTSVGEFHTGEQLAGLIADNGFERVTQRALSLGVCVCTVAHRAATPTDAAD